MLKKYIILIFFFSLPILLKSQIYLADNGLSITGTGVNKKVRLGGSLLLNTSFDLGATFTYNIKKGTANYLHILNNGNIGFGTNAPTASFDVVGSSRFRNSLSLNYGTANRTTQITDAGFYISRTSDGNYTNSITGDASMSFAARSNFSFLSNAVERVTILETGNVGIGSTNPLHKLDISGTLRSDNYTLVSSAFPTYPLSISTVANGQHKIVGSYGYEWIHFGEFGNTISFRANELYLQSNAIVTQTGASILSYGSAGLNFHAAGLAQQGDSRTGFNYISNFTSAVASGISEMSLAKYGAIINTSIGTINAYLLNLSPTLNTTAGTTLLRGIYYNPTITGSAGLTNIAFEATSGIMKLGNLAGTGIRMVVADSNGVLSAQAITSGGGSGNWNQNGNNITNSNTGFVSIGTSANPAPTDPQLKLAVNGNIYAQKLKITQQGWADYVFEPSYKLMPLNELEAFINKNKHLPDVPSAIEVETKGLDIGDNQTILLKKIEELTLYVIELKREIDTLKDEQTKKSNKK